VGMLIYPIYLTASIVISILLTWAVRTSAARLSPAFASITRRHLHFRPIPRSGGVAVFLTCLIVVFFYYLAGKAGMAQPQDAQKLFKIILASVPVFVAGIWDDRRGLASGAKLLVQTMSAVGLYFAGFRFVSMEWQFAGPLLSSAICLLATVAWVVLICNAINLIDGLDGLAAGAALFSMVTIFTVAFVSGHHDVTIGVTILAGAMLGFLVFNINPASIFLGDCGSLFVGFMLSAFVLAEAPAQSTSVDTLFVPFISFALPLTDILVSMLRRFISGHALFGADREHFHHKLLEMGLTHRQVVFILYCASAVFTLLSLFVLYGDHSFLIPVLAVSGLFLFFSVRRLGYAEFAELSSMAKRAGRQKQMFARNIAVRKATARILHAGDLNHVLASLQDCLSEDFDGFEIMLNRSFLGYHRDLLAGEDAIRHFWSDISGAKITLMLEITTPMSGIIGEILLHRRLSFHHGKAAQPLIDTELLAGDLRHALGLALERCFRRSDQVLTLPIGSRQLRASEPSMAEAPAGGD
jgi:UDP-GlcNAc:undecaprenyl-phosphate GlcNAc-1-phosphate transferase